MSIVTLHKNSVVILCKIKCIIFLYLVTLIDITYDKIQT